MKAMLSTVVGGPETLELTDLPDPEPGKGEVRIGAEDTLVFETPGGGGFGAPRSRAPEAIENDLADDLISENTAEIEYGYRREAQND